MKTLLKELLGYGAASAVALGVDAALLYALTRHAHWHTLTASAISFTAGAAVAYGLSVSFVFRSHRLRSRTVEFGGFLGLGLVGLAVNQVAMYLTTGSLGLPVLPAKAIAACCTFSTNFALRRQLLFRAAPARTVAS